MNLEDYLATFAGYSDACKEAASRAYVQACMATKLHMLSGELGRDLLREAFENIPDPVARHWMEEVRHPEYIFKALQDSRGNGV